MNIRIDIGLAQVRQIIADAIAEKLGRSIDSCNVYIEVKSKQNQSGWENAEFRAIYEELE